jgi:hypothetical protein
LTLKKRWVFTNKTFPIVIIALVVALLIDTSIVKINDLVDKHFIPIQSKVLLFLVNSSLVILLQFIAVRFVTNTFKKDRSIKLLWVNRFYIISVASLCVLASLMGSLILELFYYGYYDTAISISIILISYGTGAAFIMWLSFLFFSWFKSNHNLVVFLYFISMSFIALNLVTTAAFISANLASRPPQTSEYVGASADITSFRYSLLNNVSKITSFMSFFSIWLTTAILMNSYREKLIRSILYWILLAIPLAYFVMTYFYQLIFGNILISYLQVDPVTVSIALGAFVSLSKPIGGIVFGIALWNISKIIGYERNIRTSMIIAGWGILLIFSSNQAATQIVGPYPPFGLATVTILDIAAFMMLIGIYNSATLVSVNNDLRRYIHKHALKLLNPIGQAEMEKEIQKTVKKISDKKEIAGITTETILDLDEIELKKYLSHVIREVKKG